MARLFTHNDGRLKTGRVAALVFAGLLTLFGMLFKVNSSVDHALLAVKHVFEPAKVQSTKEKPIIKQKIARAKTPETQKGTPKKERSPEKPRTDEARKVDPRGNENTEKAAAQQATAEMSPEKSPTAEEKPPSPEEAVPGEETNSRKEPTSVDSENAEPELDGDNTFDRAALSKLARKSPEVKPRVPKSEPETINVSEKLKRLTDEPEKPTKNASAEDPEIPERSFERKIPRGHPSKAGSNR